MAVKINHIISANDGDVCNSCVTYEILKGSDPKLCIDIGVDEGWWSFFAASVNPNCQIIAFEPNPVSYNALVPYVNQQSQITLHNLAISNCSGTIPFTIAAGESNSRNPSEFHVPCSTIGEFIKDKIISLIKIDTEGHDLIILKSLYEYLENIEAIIFECTPYWYGDNKGDNIRETIGVLMILKQYYKNMYILSRRGAPILEELSSESDIVDFANDCCDSRYQVDILVCNYEIAFR
jgi:FkbM family methyltransferase